MRESSLRRELSMFVASDSFWQILDSMRNVPAQDYSSALRQVLAGCEPEQIQQFGAGLRAGIDWFERVSFISDDDRFVGDAKEAAIMGLLARGRAEIERVAESTAIVVTWDVEPFLDVPGVVDDAYEWATGRTLDADGTAPREGDPVRLHIADPWLTRQWPELGRGLDAWREPLATVIGPWLGAPNPDFLKIDLAPYSGDGRTHYKAVRHKKGIRLDIDYDADAIPRPDSFDTGVTLIEGGLELIHRKYGFPMPARPSDE
jgi:hypothetical protein